MKEISNADLCAALDMIPFDVVYTVRDTTLKTDFMGDAYYLSIFGSWYPIKQQEFWL